MTAILFRLIPWGTLISLLFTWLASKFGSGFMKWVLDLVAENATKIDFGKMTKAEAETRNIELIQKATSPSWTANALTSHPRKGINTSEAKFINWVAYMKWLSDNQPFEFASRMTKFLGGAGKLRSYSESDFMRLYTNPPDRKP